MERSVIKINEEKCVGCGLCVNACVQDALQLIDGKAKLVSEEYCDGLGMCLPQCPVDAISITSTKKDFDGVKTNFKLKNNLEESALKQWPVQLHLVRSDAEFFKDSNLLVAADCVAYALNNFHGNLLNGKSLAIACPKLDDTNEYVSKMTKILQNGVKTVTVAIMEVPCCRGLDIIVREAIELSGLDIPVKKIVISVDGRVL